MFEGKSIGVVVPAYNEERLIEETVFSMPKFVDKIIVVEDRSTDNTFRILMELKEKLRGRLIIIRHNVNRGVGAAIIRGYEECLNQGIDIAVVMAGDAQMDPGDLPALIKPIANEKADYVKGNRLLTGQVKTIMPNLRYFGNSLLTILTKIASGYWNVMDPQCGYTAISKDILKKIPLRKIYQRYGFPNDILTKLNVYNARVVDVLVKPVYGREISGIKLRSYIPKVSYLLLKCFLWRLREKYLIRDFHPLFLFYTFGFGATFFGSLLALYILYLRLFRGNIASVASIILCALLLTVGFQTTFFAMWFDMEYNRFPQGG